MTRLQMAGLLTLLAILLACPMTLAQAQEQYAEPRPVDRQETTGDTLNGCAWTLTMARDFTSLDAIGLYGQLMNNSDQQFIFDTGEPNEGNPKIVLTPKGRTPIAVELDHRKAGIGAGSGNYKPTPGEIVRAFRVDLRLIFGRLNPGEYKLQVVYPKDHYKIEHLPGYMPADIPSPTIDFVVRATTLGKTRKTMPKPGALLFTLDPRERIARDDSDITFIRSATLKNNGDKPIQFLAYVGDEKIDGALAWTERWEQYNPGQDWYESQSFGYCGTGLGMVTLKPKESVKLAINSFPDDGIYRYKIRYTTDPENRQWDDAYSDAVAIDYFAQRYLDQDEK